MSVLRAVLAVVFVVVSVAVSHADDGRNRLRIAVTTSFDNSGLAGHILPVFTKKTGIKVEMIVVGTGQALKLGKRGDVDALLVHAKSAELKFVAQGHASQRREVMYNDFVIVGSNRDPAGIRGVKRVKDALLRIKKSLSIFLSRGDDSGTHKKEISLWKRAGLDSEKFSADWYRRTGSGMGSTLNTAAGLDAYLLVDRGTWLSFKNKQRLEMLMWGDPPLHNQYGFLVINPERHPHVHYKAARALSDWLTSSEGQDRISSYRVMGQQLFNPNYQPGS